MGIERVQYGINAPGGSSSRHSCASGCLTIVAALGVLVSAALLALFISQSDPTPSPNTLPGQTGWSLYQAAAALWSIGIGVTGICLTYRPHPRGSWRANLISLLVVCILGMLFAIAWPLQILILAFESPQWQCVRRRGRLRHVLPLAFAPLLIAGTVLGVVGYRAHRLDTPSAPSTASITGTWRLGAPYGSLTLNPNGSFTATAVPEELLGGNLPGTQPGSAYGTWNLGSDDSVNLTPHGDISEPEWPNAELTRYTVDSTPVLCVSIDPDNPCDYVFRHG